MTRPAMPGAWRTRHTRAARPGAWRIASARPLSSWSAARLCALPVLAAGCGYAGETQENYEASLAAKPVWSALQQAELKLRVAPPTPYVHNADPAPDVDTIALPAADGSGYVVFTAGASKGRVLSVPSAGRIALSAELLAELRRKRLVSDAVAAELKSRSR